MLCTNTINTSNTIRTQTGAAERKSSGLDTNSCYYVITIAFNYISWWRGSVVERRSLVGELSLSCARPAADG